jgi:nucleotide-binding universal stress UspA family protein
MDAVRFANRHVRPKDRLILLSAYVDDPNAHDSFSLGNYNTAALVRSKSESSLRTAVERCALPETTKQLSIYCHDVAAEICKVARDEGVDGIVMGSRGYSSTSKIFIGSVSSSVLKNAGASTPVTIVRKPPPASAESHVTLVAIDGSQPSIEALMYAVRLCGPEDKLLLFSVYDARPPNGDVKKQEAEKAVALAAAVLKGKIDMPNTTVVVLPTQNSVAEAIVLYANEHQISSVVMGARGLSTLKKWWLGSVSEYVLERAPCPVTVVQSSKTQ